VDRHIRIICVERLVFQLIDYAGSEPQLPTRISSRPCWLASVLVVLSSDRGSDVGPHLPTLLNPVATFGHNFGVSL
jgi:hypothetical protein